MKLYYVNFADAMTHYSKHYESQKQSLQFLFRNGIAHLNEIECFTIEKGYGWSCVTPTAVRNAAKALVSQFKVSYSGQYEKYNIKIFACILYVLRNKYKLQLV